MLPFSTVNVPSWISTRNQLFKCRKTCSSITPPSLLSHRSDDLRDLVAVRDLGTIDVQTLHAVGKAGFHAVTLGLDDLLRVGGCSLDLCRDLKIRGLAGVRTGSGLDVVAHKHGKAGHAANLTVEQRILTGSRGALGKTVVQKQQRINLWRHNESAAGVRNIRLVQLRAQLYDVFVHVVFGQRDRSGRSAHSVARSGSGGNSLEQERIRRVSQRVRGATHCGVDQVTSRLHLVHIVNLEVEILAPVDNEGLVGGGQRIGRGNVGVLGIILDRDRADAVDVDGIALIGDNALIVAVDKVRRNVGLLEGVEQTRAPKLGDKSGNSHVLNSFLIQGRFDAVPIRIDFRSTHILDICGRIILCRGIRRGIGGIRAPCLRGADKPLVGAVYECVKALGVLDLLAVQLQCGHFLAAAAHRKVEICAGDVFALKVSPDSLFLRRLAFFCRDVGLKGFKGRVFILVLLLITAVTCRLEVVQLLLDAGQLLRVRLVLREIVLEGVYHAQMQRNQAIFDLFGASLAENISNFRSRKFRHVIRSPFPWPQFFGGERCIKTAMLCGVYRKKKSQPPRKTQ
nr:MAG TPA: hypothetical protein [Caudoviricetes sp.]